MPDECAISGAFAEAANDRFLHVGECKDKGSRQHDLEPPLKRQRGRVEDYLHRISMYIGNLQKRPIGSKVARRECPYQRRDEVTAASSIYRGEFREMTWDFQLSYISPLLIAS